MTVSAWGRQQPPETAVPRVPAQLRRSSGRRLPWPVTRLESHLPRHGARGPRAKWMQNGQHGIQWKGKE